MAWPGQRFLVPFDGEESYDWLEQQPRIHHPDVQRLSPADRAREHQRPGQHLLRKKSFSSKCSKDELEICVHLETPAEASRLQQQLSQMHSGMGGMQELLLEQFIEKDYGDDLLLLTATEAGGAVVGLIFWRYLRSSHDEFWQHVMVDPSGDQQLALSPRPPPDAWVLIELLCTDDQFRGRGVGKLLLVAALAYSAVKDGKTAAVLTLGRGDENLAAAELYRRLGFQPMPEELFVEPEDDGHGRWVDPRHVLVLWDIRQSLRSLTLQEVSGAAKGTVVPQLEDDKEELQRMDSSHCVEVA